MLVTFAGGAMGAAQVVQRTQLDAAPESVAFTADGRLFATLFETGEVVEVLGSGDVRRIARLPASRDGVPGHALGIAAGPDGNLYVAFRQRSPRDADDFRDAQHPACRDASIRHTGLYRVHPDTGKVDAVATRADGWPVCFPNGVAVDASGNVYVADFTYAGIWRLAPGKDPEMWSNHPLLNWAPSPWSLAPFGVNAIALDHDGRAIIAGTVGTPRILRLRIRPDGSSADPEVVQADGGPTDGIAVAADGTIFTSETMRNEIWALTADGSRRRLVAHGDNAPLDGNAGLAIRGEKLCVANLGFPKIDESLKDRTIVCFGGLRPFDNANDSPRTVVPR
jgi:sugar lactone lactonase YvrE